MKDEGWRVYLEKRDDNDSYLVKGTDFFRAPQHPAPCSPFNESLLTVGADTLGNPASKSWHDKEVDQVAEWSASYL